MDDPRADRRLLRQIVAATILAALVAGLGGWWLWQQHAALARRQARQGSLAVAGSLLQAWEQHRYGALPELIADPPPGVGRRVRATMQRLGVSDLELERGPVRLVDEDDPRAGARVGFTAHLTLAGLGDWTYTGAIPTRPAPAERAGGWLIDWSAGILHPALGPGQRLDRRLSWPSRAPILGADGRPLEPGGTQLDRIVGGVGQIGAERARALGRLYRAGDTAGISGLQSLFERRLAGAPSGRIHVTEGGEPVEVLASFPGRRPRPVRTGLDPGVQRAAERALAAAPGPAAMVVLTPDSKAIRAVVNAPAGFDRALGGQYAPGSTFKVVTTLALLRRGIQPSTPASCPGAASVGGRRFTNYEDAAYGTIPFRQAFYLSCNTAFVQLAAELPDGALLEAVRTMGFNRDWTLGIADPYHSFPPPQDLADRAAAAFGQGRVAASPVAMAAVAAAVISGAWDNPWLAAPQRGQLRAQPLGEAAGVIADLMQEVPRRGTAAGAGLPEGIGGKTGTAEVRRGGALVNDTWFIGFDARPPAEPLAWAVLVENGRSGGSTAAPLAARFLQLLGRG